MAEIYRSLVSDRRFTVKNVYRCLAVDIEDVLMWTDSDGEQLANGDPYSSVISLLDNEMDEKDPYFTIKRGGYNQGNVIVFNGIADKEIYDQDNLQIWLDVDGSNVSVMSRDCEYIGKVISLE